MKREEAIAYCERMIEESPPRSIQKDVFTSILGLVNGGFVDAAIQGRDGRERFIVYGAEDEETGEREILANQVVNESFEFFKEVCSEVGELVPKKPNLSHWWILKLD